MSSTIAPIDSDTRDDYDDVDVDGDYRWCGGADGECLGSDDGGCGGGD